MQKGKDSGFESRTELIEKKELRTTVAVPKKAVKRLVASMVRAYSIENVFERINIERINVPSESEASRKLITYIYGLVSDAVKSSQAEDRSKYIEKVASTAPMAQGPVAKQVLIWAFNLKDQIAIEGKNALDKVCADTDSLSDTPLWEMKR